MEESRHPFLEGLSKHRGVVPTVAVIFGASGDLTARKLIPAIYNLSVDNLLPNDFRLIGFGRKAISDEDFRDAMEASIKEHSRRPINSEIWERVRDAMFYASADYGDIEGYKRLAEQIDGIEASLGRKVQRIFYVSTPPSVFEPIIECLGKSGLAQANLDTPLASKVIIEKPFGRDL